MKTPVTNARSGDRHCYTTDMDLLVHPLDALEEDHLRLRTECVTLDRLSDDDLTELRSAMPRFNPAAMGGFALRSAIPIAFLQLGPK